MAGALRQPLRMSTIPPAAGSAMLARALFPAGSFAATAFTSACASAAQQRLPSTLQQRRYASHSRKRGGGNSPSPSTEMHRQSLQSNSAMVAFRIPQTLVPPPMSRYIAEPAKFFKMLFYVARQRVADKASEWSIRLQSKPSFFTRAAYRPKTATLLPMAKAMHIEMLEAIAAKDTNTLRNILTVNQFNEVGSLLARRPPNRRCEWELLSYKGKPRIMDSKVVLIPGGVGSYVRQIVVQIKSRQRFTWTTVGAGGRVTGQPTITEKDVTENVIFVAALHPGTWQTDPWRVFGFMTETTLEDWENEKNMLERLV